MMTDPAILSDRDLTVTLMERMALEFNWSYESKKLKRLYDEFLSRGLDERAMLSEYCDNYYPPYIFERVRRENILFYKKQNAIPADSIVKEKCEDYGVPEMDISIEEIGQKTIDKLMNGAVFFAQVKGESMAGAELDDDDSLIVDKSLQDYNNKIVVARIWGNRILVKKFIRNNGHIILKSENPEHKNIIVTEDMDLQIIGVVKGKFLLY